jgi:gentisate 1,2-dioxygenase
VICTGTPHEVAFANSQSDRPLFEKLGFYREQRAE